MRRLIVLLFATLLVCSSLQAEVVRILDDPREAAQARLDLIQQADHEVSAVYFLARNDRITLSALTLLRDARRRGVSRVRLIVDANFNRIPKGVLAYLRSEGVEVRVYHPLKLRHPSWLFRRMHEKFVVVDARRYITGGRNLAKAYFGLAKKNYLDRDVYVDGSSALEVSRHFENMWSSRQVVDLHVRAPAAELRKAQEILDTVRHELEGGEFLALGISRDWSAGLPDSGAVRFLHDPIGEERGPRLAVQLADLLGQATKSIVIESPYFVPSRKFLELLEKKMGEGVTVQIITNSLRSTDGVFPQAAYLKYRHRLLRAGVDVREYKGPDVLHAKSAIIDDRTVLIGSYNVDPRSQNLNLEAMCVVQDDALAESLGRSIGTHIANAWHIHPRGGAGIGEHYPGVSRTRSFRAWMARLLLLPVVEGQL